jgi:hypothetical protein
VAYIEFAEDGQTQIVVDWTTIHDLASPRAFADRIAAAPPSAPASI